MSGPCDRSRIFVKTSEWRRSVCGFGFYRPCLYLKLSYILGKNVFRDINFQECCVCSKLPESDKPRLYSTVSKDIILNTDSWGSSDTDRFIGFTVLRTTFNVRSDCASAGLNPSPEIRGEIESRKWSLVLTSRTCHDIHDISGQLHLCQPANRSRLN